MSINFRVHTLEKLNFPRECLIKKLIKFFSHNTLHAHKNQSVSSVQLLSRVQLFMNPWMAARQASLSIPNSQSLLKLMSIESVIPSSHLILCRPLLLLPSILLSIRVFFQWVSSSHQVTRVLEFQLQHQSFQWTNTCSNGEEKWNNWVTLTQ